MAKNRYKGEQKAFIGQMRVLSTDNPFVKKVVIDALNDKVNRNGWKYINLSKHLSKFRNIPLLTAYLPTGKIGDGHNYKVKKDPKTGKEYASFTGADAERIVGWVPESAKVELADENGVTWVRVEANLWAWYAQELVSQIVEQGNSHPMEVSIETLILSEHIEDEVAVEEEYEILGITILGKGVAPAVAGATLKSLADLTAMRDSMTEMRLKAASYDTPAAKTNNKSTERVNKLTYFSKKQCAELEKKFEGYQVLAAAQDEENIFVCLMKDCSQYTYTMADLNETIATEKICGANPSVAFTFGDKEIKVDCCIVTDGMSAEVVRANTAVEAANATAKKCEDALEKANATIKEMQEAEDKRRVCAAKNAAETALKEFNANRADKVDAKCLEAITADIEGGKYTNLCAEGVWTGEEAVKERVFAACAMAQMELDKVKADKAKTVFAWENLAGGNKDNNADTIGNILASMGVS